MIEVSQLTKRFGYLTAVDDISFTVNKGEILGFLGPNGAGKSTTMRMVTGFIPPTSGTVTIGGQDVVRNPIEAQRKIGYLPENAPVYPDMTVSGYLDFIAQIRGFAGGAKKRVVEDTIVKCFLSEVRFQTIATLSKGFKQRVCFAQSILHDPEFLILDEPTDGLDPNQKHEVRLMIREMSAQKAIIFSTHILDEVDAVCTRAIIIAGGKIVADESPAQLRQRSPHHGAVSLSVGTADPSTVPQVLGQVEGVAAVNVIDTHADRIDVRILPQSADCPIADKIVSTVLSHHYTVHSLFVESGRLDEVFRDITGGRV
jgi:ABC-2 type transport system ATP-binding protein